MRRRRIQPRIRCRRCRTLLERTRKSIFFVPNFAPACVVDYFAIEQFDTGREPLDAFSVEANTWDSITRRCRALLVRLGRDEEQLAGFDKSRGCPSRRLALHERLHSVHALKTTMGSCSEDLGFAQRHNCKALAPPRTRPPFWTRTRSVRATPLAASRATQGSLLQLPTYVASGRSASLTWIASADTLLMTTSPVW